jgi:hypothetical protein
MAKGRRSLSLCPSDLKPGGKMPYEKSEPKNNCPALNLKLIDCVAPDHRVEFYSFHRAI